MIEFSKPVEGVSTTYPVEVDGDGDVCFQYHDGYDSESSFEITIPELRRILAQAEQHYNAYVAFKNSGYEEEAYYRAMVDVDSE